MKLFENAHLQTMRAAVPPPRTPIPGVRELGFQWPLPEGGSLIARGNFLGRRAPCGVIVHGAGGSSEDTYVRRAGRALNHAGFHALRLNLRGSGLGQGLSNRHYHAAQTEDLEIALRAMMARDDVEDVSLLGFSLGGHSALCVACMDHPPDGLRGIVTISAPVDLLAGAKHLREHRPTLYELLMVRTLIDNSVGVKRRDPTSLPASMWRLRAMIRVSDFDRLVIAPGYGYPTADAYYSDQRISNTIEKLRVPTLLIHAADDPLCPAHSVIGPIERAGPGLTAQILPRGGHVGFARGLEGSVAVQRGLRFLWKQRVTRA